MSEQPDLHLTTEYEGKTLWPEHAVTLVRNWAVTTQKVPREAHFYMVWFSFTLGNWKALVSSTEPDGRYYEITHDVQKSCTYIDCYVKTQNVKILDQHIN